MFHCALVFLAGFPGGIFVEFDVAVGFGLQAVGDCGRGDEGAARVGDGVAGGFGGSC